MTCKDTKPVTSKPKPKRKVPQHVYMRFKVLQIPKTSQLVMVLQASSAVDREILKAKNFKAGDLVRVEIKKPRNYKFHKLVHKLGQLVSENIEGFEGLQAHQVIKKLQRDGKVLCDESVFDLGELGTIIQYIPRSLAFDDMDDPEFYQCWQLICQYLIKTYWHNLTPAKIENMVSAMPDKEAI